MWAVLLRVANGNGKMNPRLVGAADDTAPETADVESSAALAAEQPAGRYRARVEPAFAPRHDDPRGEKDQRCPVSAISTQACNGVI